MKKIVVYTVLFALCPLLLISQTPDTLWTKTYGGDQDERGRSVQQTTDDGYIIAGHTQTFGAGSFDVYLIKTDAFGDTLWTRTFGGTNRDEGFSVQQTTDGGYIVVGFTESYGSGEEDVYLIKTDPFGDRLWTRTYGGSAGDYGMSVQQTTDGGYIIAGFSRSYTATCDAYLVKTDSLGDTLWTRTYGGGPWDEANSVQQTTDGGYILAGETYSYGVNGAVYLIKTDSLGDTLWTRTYGGQGQDEGNSVQQTFDGGYIICGTKDMGNISKVYLVKTDSIGDTLWTRTPAIGLGHFVQQTTDSGYVITGNVNDDVYLAKTNTLGVPHWARTYGELIRTEFGHSVQQTNDGGFIATGLKHNFYTYSDVWLLKIALEPWVGEKKVMYVPVSNMGASVLHGSLILPSDKPCRVFDITGRVVMPDRIKPGIYFIEIDGKIIKKVVKIR